MKKQIAFFIVAASLAVVPLAFTTGCASTSGKESAGAYSQDKEIQSKIKTALNADPVTKGTEVGIQSLGGVVELSGFVDSQQAKDRAGQIAATTPGVVKVYNNLVTPTGR
jgi:osmotically-inducible protein OsmY